MQLGADSTFSSGELTFGSNDITVASAVVARGKNLLVEEIREPGASLPTSGVTHIRVIAEYGDPQYQMPPICNAAGRLVFARGS